MIDIYADGADVNKILELNKNNFIRGFTTNPSLMRNAGIVNYKDFAKEILKKIPDKPISFEVFADNIELMEAQALEISSWGKNVNIKIPITNTKGVSTVPLIKRLTERKIKCNITAIFTIKQISLILDNVNLEANLILSIFAGRIADTGRDPKYIIKEAIDLAKNYKQIKILWASTREVLNISQAEEIGCHIITVTPDILEKLNLKNKNLEEYSLETVKMFYNDAQKSNYNIS